MRSPGGSSSTNSLMKVATLSFERTVVSQRFTPNTASGTSMARSSFTVTWQASR